MAGEIFSFSKLKKLTNDTIVSISQHNSKGFIYKLIKFDYS